MKASIAGKSIGKNGLQPCQGTIEILDRSEHTVYVSWSLFDSSHTILATVSRSYFIGDRVYSNADIMDKIIQDILDHRIGRKRVFSELIVL